MTEGEGAEAIIVHEVRLVAVSELKAHPRNYNDHPETQRRHLAQSFRDAGFYRNVVTADDLTVLAGHGVWETAIEEGMPRVPAVVLPFGPDDPRAIRVLSGDNEIPRMAERDEAALAALLQEVAFDGGLLGTGYDEAALAALLESTAEPVDRTRRTEPDDVPEIPTDPKTRRGELWGLGPHRLLCGDSFRTEDVAHLLAGDERLDLVLTDPPYAIYGSSTGISADIAEDKMVRPFFEAVGRTIRARLKPFGHAYVHCDWRSFPALVEGLKTARLSPKNCIVWDKGGQGLGSSYANTYELIAFFAHLPEMKAMTSSAKRGQRQVFQPNIFRTNRPAGDDRLHNAAKPVDLLRWLVRNSTDPGEVVLDLFGGSGSTLIAAHQEGRAARVVEMEPRHCDVILRRFEDLTGEVPELLASEVPEPVTGSA